MIDLPPMRKDRTLLRTVTGEPFQPARLYYTIPGKTFVARIFSRLRCMDEDADNDRWVWLYADEATRLVFGKPHAELPDHVHPIVIGAARFPPSGGMTLQVRSFPRAISAARFFGPRLGPDCAITRLRMVNRFFDAAESKAGLDALDRMLDQDVTVVDPVAFEMDLKRHLEGAKTSEEALRALERYGEELRREGRDVPLVEDLPLRPEEETHDFLDLANTLQLRSIRAYQHWNGNTHVTLQDVIMEAFGSGGTRPGATRGPSPLRAGKSNARVKRKSRRK